MNDEEVSLQEKGPLEDTDATEEEAGIPTLLERIGRIVRVIRKTPLLRHIASTGAGVIAGISAMQVKAQPLGNSLGIEAISGYGQLSVFETDNPCEFELYFPVPEPGDMFLPDFSKVKAQLVHENGQFRMIKKSEPEPEPKASMPDTVEHSFTKIRNSNGEIVPFLNFGSFTTTTTIFRNGAPWWDCSRGEVNPLDSIAPFHISTSTNPDKVLIAGEPNPSTRAEEIYLVSESDPTPCANATLVPHYSTRGPDYLVSEIPRGDLSVAFKKNGLSFYKINPETGEVTNVVTDPSTFTTIETGFLPPGVPDEKFNDGTNMPYGPAITSCTLDEKIIKPVFFLRDDGIDDNKAQVYWYPTEIKDIPIPPPDGDGDGVPDKDDNCPKEPNEPDSKGIQHPEACNPPYSNFEQGVSFEGTPTLIRDKDGNITEATLDSKDDKFLKTQANRTLTSINTNIPPDIAGPPPEGTEWEVTTTVQLDQGKASVTSPGETVDLVEGVKEEFKTKVGETLTITNFGTQVGATLTLASKPTVKPDAGEDAADGGDGGDAHPDTTADANDGGEQTDGGIKDAEGDSGNPPPEISPPPPSCGGCNSTGAFGAAALGLAVLATQKNRRRKNHA